MKIGQTLFLAPGIIEKWCYFFCVHNMTQKAFIPHLQPTGEEQGNTLDQNLIFSSNYILQAYRKAVWLIYLQSPCVSEEPTAPEAPQPSFHWNENPILLNKSTPNSLEPALDCAAISAQWKKTLLWCHMMPSPKFLMSSTELLSAAKLFFLISEPVRCGTSRETEFKFLLFHVSGQAQRKCEWLLKNRINGFKCICLQFLTLYIKHPKI